eukprot:g7838.t1
MGLPFGQMAGWGAIPGSIYGWLIAHAVLRFACWLFSFAYHVLDAHQDGRVRDLAQTLDFVGIYTSFVGMGGNAINALCLSTCSSGTVRAALLGWGTCASCAAIAVSFTARFRADSRVCGGVFGLVMMSYVVPIAALGSGLPGAPLRHLVRSCSAAACGGICFVLRFPERIVKRRFDVLAPSHSLWHWSNAPHDLFVSWFVWECTALALAQRFQCPPDAASSTLTSEQNALFARLHDSARPPWYARTQP